MCNDFWDFRKHPRCSLDGHIICRFLCGLHSQWARFRTCFIFILSDKMSWQPEAPVIFVGKQIVLDESVFSVSPFCCGSYPCHILVVYCCYLHPRNPRVGCFWEHLEKGNQFPQNPGFPVSLPQLNCWRIQLSTRNSHITAHHGAGIFIHTYTNICTNKIIQFCTGWWFQRWFFFP